MPKKEIQVRPDSYFTSMYTIFGLMLAGSLAIVALLVYQAAQGPVPLDPGARATLAYLIIAVFIAAIAIAHTTFKGRVDRMQSASLAKKLRTFQKASIIRWGILQGGVILVTFAYYLSSHILTLAALAGLLVYFAWTYPSRPRFVSQFKLTLHERNLILKG